MSIVQFIPENYMYIIKNIETTPIILGVLAGPTLNTIGIGTGSEAVEYYGEVHLSKWNSVIHTVGMPFTTYGFAVAAPALFNLPNRQAIYLQKCLLIIYFIHYLTFDPILAVFVFLFYSFPLYFAMQTYTWSENKKELVSYGLKTAAGALFFQEVIGHTIGGDEQSRLEAVPNAIVYAMHYSVSHILHF